MTVKQLSDLFNVSGETIKNAIRELYPLKMQKGKKTILDKDESVKIGEIVRKRGYIQPTNNLQVLTKNEQVDRLDRLERIVETLVTTIPNMIQKTIEGIQSVKQIEIKQDYYSILGYCKIKGIKLTFFESIKIGKEATKLSKQKNIDIRKIPDERFGEVGSYHISILDKIFKGR